MAAPQRLFFIILLCLLMLCVGSVSAQWCGVQTLYFQNAPSPDLTGYEQLINYPSGATETDEVVIVRNTLGTVLIDSYISPPGYPGVEYIEKGLRRYRTFGYVDTASGVTRFNFTPFVRYANGTEMNLYTVMSDDINDLTVNEHLTSYVSPVNLTLGPTSRLGIRVSANTTHSANVNIHWVYEGTYHYSSVESGNFVCEPLPVSAGSSVYPGVDAPLNPIIPVLALCAAVAFFIKRR